MMRQVSLLKDDDFGYPYEFTSSSAIEWEKHFVGGSWLGKLWSTRDSVVKGQLNIHIFP